MIDTLVIVTGMSGAGKSTAIKALEDLDFFCVDNLPIVMLPSLLTHLAERPQTSARVAVVADIRQPTFHEQAQEIFAALQKVAPPRPQILFLDTQDAILARRYAESRRPHPLSKNSISEGIRRERLLLAPLRDSATWILDTSILAPQQLRRRLQDIFLQGSEKARLQISLVSFGFKYGPPMDADLLFDVRFLPNPYWVESLRPLTGEDEGIAVFLEDAPDTAQTLEHFLNFLHFLFPRFQQSDRRAVTLAIGCTGGQHRSVYVARCLQKRLEAQGYNVSLMHRDIQR